MNINDKLEELANEILNQNVQGIKPNYSDNDFLNSLLIFQNALMDKMFDNQNFDDMQINDRLNMANCCGSDLRKLIHTYTGLDTFELVENMTKIIK